MTSLQSEPHPSTWRERLDQSVPAVVFAGAVILLLVTVYLTTIGNILAATFAFSMFCLLLVLFLLARVCLRLLYAVPPVHSREPRA